MHGLDISTLSGGNASFMNGVIYKIPIRSFVPSGLYQCSFHTKNLKFLGCFNNEITSGSIGFSYEEALTSTLGEFLERYCAGFYNPEDLICGTYKDLKKQGYNLLPPSFIRPFASYQYKKKFPYKEFTEEDTTYWSYGTNLITGNQLLVPSFLVFLPFKWTDRSEQYIQNTSTGLSSHHTPIKAITNSFFECAERHAFSQFWYFQNSSIFSSYSPQTVINSFPSNSRIKVLFKNPYVKIRVYDLSEFSMIESIVVLMQFKYKDSVFQTIGAASRFKKERAIEKACLEAYQGIDYVLSLKDKIEDKEKFALPNLDSFEKHAMYYNIFPERRKKVPILKDFFENPSSKSKIKFDSQKIKNLSKESLSELKLNYLISHNITTTDVKSLGINVVRICIPEWALLTGNHKTPFLGANVFKNKKNLFTNLPHPFP